MLTLSAEALAFLRGRGEPIFLELPPVVRGCCFDFQECPSVRLGAPRDPHRYEARQIDDVVVLVPRPFPDELALEIRFTSFLGFKRLVVEGWRYC